MIVTIANREDPDQTSEAVCLVLHCLSMHFWQATSVQNFKTFTVLMNFCMALYDNSFFKLNFLRYTVLP